MRRTVVVVTLNYQNQPGKVNAERGEVSAMETTIKGYLEGLTLGEIQIHKHVAVIPVMGTNGSGPDYLTMKEAMDRRLIQIGEVGESGHVPELKVINTGLKPVLLLDGEELAGAKQNRVLNTTVLIREKSETIIPVSCTEHGRWSYRSQYFEESCHIMSARLRGVKNASVHENLKDRSVFASDQFAVWDGIRVQATANKVDAPTGAMRDVLKAKQEDLDDFLELFPLMDRQKGLLVLVNGEVVGMDVISKKEAFALLHSKLVKSYVMDALTEMPKKNKDTGTMKAADFLKKILVCGESAFDSVGYGRDYRYEGEGLVGSALVHEGTVIHLAFFQINKADKTGRMSSVNRRRSYRTNQ